MISNSIFDFLKKLIVNNNREWFNNNKELYTDAKKEFDVYINFLISELSKTDKDIKGLEAKNCVFRIYRDVRFAKDKSPYKPNFGAYITKNGQKSGYAGYYIHVEPDNSFLGAGIYCPEPSRLKAIRTKIYNNTNEFKEIINNKDLKKFSSEIYGEKLKSAPKGFPKDFADIDLLKFKSYSLMNYISDDLIVSNKFNKFMFNMFKTIQPFNNFLNHAIEQSITNSQQ